LTDAEKGQLVSIWIIAADKKGIIPDDVRIIQKICMLDNAPNVNKFIELGFLTSNGCHHDVIVTPNGCQGDVPDKIRVETETETETATSKSTNRERSVNEAQPNQEPGTRNQEQGLNNTSKTSCNFDSFWLAYPKKVGKKKTRAIWKRRKLDRIAEQIISDVENRIHADQKWIDGYIPNPTTYLNGDRWEDEITRIKKPQNLAEMMKNYKGGNPFEIKDGSVISEQ